MKTSAFLITLTVMVATPIHAQQRSNYPTVDEPAHFAESYYPETRYREDQTQAAYLLILLNLLQPQDGVSPEDMAPVNDLRSIGLSERLYEVANRSIEIHNLEAVLAKYNLVRDAPRAFNENLVQAQRKLARNVAEKAELADITDLAVISFNHPDPLVRLAAAPLLIVLTDARPMALEALRRGARSDDDRLALLALTLLARFSPKDSALDAFGDVYPTDPGAKEQPRTTVVIHGTFAQNETWWRNGYPFFEYLEHDVPITDLFLGDDPYNWSGNWSNTARQQAAAELVAWYTEHDEKCLNVVAHSHGSNVAFLADAQLKFGRMIVLSTPYHPNLYSPDADSTILSLRVHMDLVVLADGGGNRFPQMPKLTEEYIGWFNHSATHDEQRWTSKSVPSMLPGGECSNLP